MLAVLQMARADDAVSLAANYSVGQSQRYKTTTVTQVLSKDVTLTEIVKRTVKEIKPSGDVVFVVAPESRTLVFGGSSPQNMPVGQSVTETYTKSGKLQDVQLPDISGGPITPAALQLLIAVNNPIFPDKPVKEGDSWETQLDDPVVKGKQVTIKDTYLGIEKNEGVTLWKIKQTVEAQVNDTGDKMTSEMTSLLDSTTGQIISEEGKVSGLPSGAFGLLSWTSKTVLLKK